MIKSNKNKTLTIFIVILGALGIVSFFIWIGIGMMSGVTKNQVNYFKVDSNYEEIRCRLTQNNYGTFFVSIDNNYKNTGFKFWGENASIIDSGDFWKDVDIGTEVTIITAPRILWDGYTHPIVGLKIENKTYLDFETGKENQIKELQAMRKKYLSLSIPVICISISCICGSIAILFASIIYKHKRQN